MADLLLIPDAQTGLWDFSLKNGDLERTALPWPAILRLLSQGTWIGDDGERAGDCFNDVTTSTTGTKDRLTRIAQTRLAALLRTGQITAVQVLSVTVVEGRATAAIQVTIPGDTPRVIQVPLTR